MGRWEEAEFGSRCPRCKAIIELYVTEEGGIEYVDGERCSWGCYVTYFDEPLYGRD